MKNIFTDEEFAEEFGIDIDTLVSTRLDDLADQIKQHYVAGSLENAELLNQEGLELAKYADSGEPFFYAKDLTALL